MAATATQTEPKAARRSQIATVDVALLAGVLALLAFPGLARFAASRLPIEPGPAVVLPPARATPRGHPLRDLPVGRAGPIPARPADLRAAAVALLGPRDGERLIALVSSRTYNAVGATAIGGSFGSAPYPYRYRETERILPARFDRAQVARATDLGARLMDLAAQTNGYGSERYSGAGPVAFALLERAREAGGCAPALNLLALVASDDIRRDDVVPAEAARAARACPGEVTPGWLAGQFQSQRALLESSTPVVANDKADEQRLVPRPFAAFRALERRFPGAPAAWSGHGDADLRLAYQLPADQPFRARRLYAEALALYRRAARLHPDPGLDAGMARALAGLGRPAAAAVAQRQAINASPPSAALSAALVEYLESARRFAEAARVARALPSLPRMAAGTEPLYPYRRPAFFVHPLNEQDAVGPLSLDTGRVKPLVSLLQPAGGGADASVQDLSFIPRFRPTEGITGSHRWCADWSARRDEILAGRPRDALAGFPKAFHDLREPVEFSVCEPLDGARGLAGIAQLELGDVAAARRDGDLDTLEADRQEMWRYAGDLPRAERAARDWARRRGHVAGPRLALGEIEFLQRRYDAAARDFGAAARIARDTARGGFATAEAEGLLKRGAALAAGGRRDEALPVLAAADDVASRVYAYIARYRDPDPAKLAKPGVLSYYARVQAGDANREAGRLKAASDAYAAARERIPLLTLSHTAFSRPSLEDDAAIVAVALRRYADGSAAARRAVAGDPQNPAFLMTEGFAEERARHADAAIAADRAALAADPTTYPAANDLGVLLARRGNEEAAVAALRRAVGANPAYALGWFNLGVVLSRMGPLHLLSSQGALGRAIALDSALRDRKRVLTIDERTYRTGLDLGRPLPPEWSFAGSQRRAPARTAGLVALLLVAFGVARGLATSRNGRALAEKWLESVAKLKWLKRSWPAAVGVMATLAVFAWPLARAGSGGLVAAVAALAGVVVLVGAVVRSRVAAARRASVAAPASSWPPGVAFGLVASGFGLPWAPLPVVAPPEKTGGRVHWAGPLAVVGLGLALTVLAVWTEVPLTRAAAVAGLVMAASLLTPVKPLDGAAVSAAGAKGSALAILGLAVLVTLGLL